VTPDDAAAAAAPEPYLKIRPRSGWASLRLGEVWRYRDLLLTLAGRDVKLRYRQTALGAAWVLLQPLLGAGIFALVFGVIADMPAPSAVPYFVLAYVGQLAWGLFSNTLTRSSASMVGNAHLVSKIYFPRLVLPLSTVPSVLIDFAVAAALVAVLLVVCGVNPGPRVLLLPVWSALLLLLALGLGLLCAAATVTYRDVAYVLPVATQLLLYASPVGYTLAAARDRLPAWAYSLYLVNPLAGLTEAFRWSLLGEGELRAGPLAYSAAAAVGSFLLGALVFRRMERRFADVI
jgi:lipopolysaccharide transport system permease protein